MPSVMADRTLKEVAAFDHMVSNGTADPSPAPLSDDVAQQHAPWAS